MEKIKINLIQLGDTYPVNYKKLEALGKTSKLLSIHVTTIINHQILNRLDGFRLMDDDFRTINIAQTSTDFSIIIVNRPLQYDYFSRPISSKLIAVTIFDMESLNIHEGINIEMYLSRLIYAFATIFYSYGNRLPDYEEAMPLLQMEAKGCLFDFCYYKPQIAIFFRNPHISPEAFAILRTKELPKNFLGILEKEIKNLKIGRFYKIKDWLKENPIKAIFLTFFLSLILSSILGNYFYELIHTYLPFIKKSSINTPTRTIHDTTYIYHIDSGWNAKSFKTVLKRGK